MDYLNYSDSDDSDLFPEDNALPSFDIGLSLTGDIGSSFRTENNPSAPFQRRNYIERKGAVDIRCSCLDVVHGFYAPEEQPATLLVLEFRFDPRKRARRFESVAINLEFDTLAAGGSKPEVAAIAPDKTRILAPTTQHEDITRNASLQLGAAAPVGGITATGTVGWNKAISRETRDQTTVVGSIDLKGRWGPQDCASWSLMENETAKTGVPSFMRTAILLKRKDNSPFKCVIKIDACVDFKSTLERVFGGKGREPKDDPVYFDPELPATNNLQQYNINALGALDLWSFCDVSFPTLFERATK